MKNLSLSLLIEKNRLATPNPWLLFLDVKLPDDTLFHLVRNNEDLVFQARTYTAFPFELEPPEESSQGEIPTATLRVSNVTRFFEPYLALHQGGAGTVVTLTLVNAAYLAEDYAELALTFDVLSTASDAQWVTFTLGAPNPLLNRYPRRRALANHCGVKYKSAECGYTGGLTTCERTLTDCRAHNNSRRFGGQPGLLGGIRLV